MPSVPRTVRFGRFRGSGVADRVVHVRERVVCDRARQIAIEVHSVNEYPIVTRTRFESLAGVDIFGAFGDVDVDTDVECFREPTNGVEGGVGQRKASVRADVAAAAASEVALVLGESRLGLVEPVPVGDLVASREADADFGARVGHHRERAVDGRSGMRGGR